MAGEQTDVLDTEEAGRAAVRGSALRTAGYVTGLGLSLISAPLLIRHLGASRFAEYFSVIALVTIVASLTEGGLNSIALREYAARRGEARTTVLRDLIGIRLSLSFAGALIAVAIAFLFGYSSTLVLGTAIAVSGQMLQVFQTLLGMSLQGEMRFGWITGLELVRQLVSVLAIVALVLVGAGVLPFLAVPVLAGIATLSLTLSATRGLIHVRPAFHASRWMPLLRDTLPYAAAIAVSVLYFRIAVLAMSLLSTSEQTGYFSAAFRVVEVLVGVPALIAGAAFPILARAVAANDEERFHYAAGRLVETTMVLGTAMSLFLVLGAEPVIRIIGGPSFGPSVPVLRIQGIALMATCLASSTGYALLALRRHGAILIANAIALVVALAMSAVLIPEFDAKGGAVAVVIAEFSLALTLIVLLLRTRPELRQTILLRPAAIVALGALSGAVALIPLHAPVLTTALGLLAFALLLALTGYMPPELRELLARSAAAQDSGAGAP